MNKYNCNKCGSENMFIEKHGNNTGLYCSKCGKWQRWLGKDELRVFEYSMRESTKEENESVDKYIKSISKPTGVNLFDNSTIIERLERFVEGINKEIDCEYEKRPISVEDNVRKNAYCYALEKCKAAIGNILDGREFNDLGE